MNSSLCAKDITISYNNKNILKNLSFALDTPQIVSIIGPNGAGKSTLLKALSRVILPEKGSIFLDGKEIQKLPSKEVARSIAMLPQSAGVPDDFLVTDLVSLGRSPYQKRFSSFTAEDKKIIKEVMLQTNTTKFKNCYINSLSGGERQRVWLAMALAQQPKILLLDEPTTFLDIHHQLEIMELVKSLHERLKISVIMVLHDLNHAVRYSERVVVVKDGEIFADGLTKEVLTEENFAKIYEVKARKILLREDGNSYCAFIPYAVCK